MNELRAFACALTIVCLLACPATAMAQSAQPLTISPSPKSATEIQPSFVTLALTDSLSIDTEIIQWPDGSFSIPVKTFAALFGISTQQSEEDHRLFFVDPTTQKKVDLYWEQQRVSVNDKDLQPGTHPMVRSTGGLLVKDDIYLDQAIFSALFQSNFTFDSDTTTLSLSTSRKLKLAQSDGSTENLNGTDTDTKIIRNPEISRRVVDKLYIQHNSNYGFQTSEQPSGVQNRLASTYFKSMVDNSTLGMSGSVFGLSYYVKPSIIRYNNKSNFQQIDWSLQREGKRNVVSLGSADAGLSPLASPALILWGLKVASRNALMPTLSAPPSYEYSGKATTGNQITVRINDRMVQTVLARDNAYEFEPVYLQSQTLNHIQITEKDSQNQEKVILDKTVGSFANMLPKGEAGYSAFAGRVPIQFYPLIPDQKTPIRMPQSEKWLTGGRVFYGLNNRLTAGVSGAADHIFGRPKTYYTSLNPFSVDLTGFSSYQRDPNFFSGENLALSLRYQMTDRWLASTELGMGRMNLKPGTLLNIPHTASGKAGQLHLERQGSLMSWYVDAFRYDPYYYTPSALLYGNTLYDKQGLATGITGAIGKILPVHYNLNYSRYQTNLEQLIPGGFINANRVGGTINAQINNKNTVGAMLGWVRGTNHEREFLQKSLDLNWRTQSLPWRLQGEIRASHYFTNTLFFPSKSLGSTLAESPYTNNILDTGVDAPLGKRGKNHVKFGNRLSSFVDYGYVQGFFQYKNFFFEPLCQLSYGDRPQKQNRMGLKVGYQLSSGAQFSVSYYKIASTFQPLLGSLPSSSIHTNQFYVDFTDILGLMANRIQSLGPNGGALGIITGKLFADYHPDGKMDKTEPGVKGIKMMVDKQQVVTTDQAGRYSLAGLSSGYHTIEVLPEDLPLTLNAENPIYKLRVAEGKTHLLNIALIPEGGTLSGQLALVDIAGKTIAPKNVTLVLLTPNGDSVKYTAVDEQGHYKFSNIPTGRYQIDLESKLKGSGRYKILETPSIVELPIPKHYEDSSAIENLDFKLLVL